VILKQDRFNGDLPVIIPDKYERTVRLPIRFKDGQWLLADGTPLPKIENDTLMEVILPAYALTDPKELALWTAEGRFAMFPAGTSLWVIVRGPGGQLIKEPGCVQKTELPGVPISTVEVHLNGALELTLRPGKNGVLRDCPCAIGALGVEARSLNEAYTLVSQKYETHRRSHSGNVFERVFYEDGEHLRPLKSRRIDAELSTIRKT